MDDKRLADANAANPFRHLVRQAIALTAQPRVPAKGGPSATRPAKRQGLRMTATRTLLGPNYELPSGLMREVQARAGPERSGSPRIPADHASEPGGACRPENPGVGDPVQPTIFFAPACKDLAPGRTRGLKGRSASGVTCRRRKPSAGGCPMRATIACSSRWSAMRSVMMRLPP